MAATTRTAKNLSEKVDGFVAVTVLTLATIFSLFSTANAAEAPTVASTTVINDVVSVSGSAGYTVSGSAGLTLDQ